LSVRGRTSAFLLDVNRLCGALEERLSAQYWIRTGWQDVISQGNALDLKYSATAGSRARARERVDILPLSYHD